MQALVCGPLIETRLKFFLPILPRTVDGERTRYKCSAERIFKNDDGIFGAIIWAYVSGSKFN